MVKKFCKISLFICCVSVFPIIVFIEWTATNKDFKSAIKSQYDFLLSIFNGGES